MDTKKLVLRTEPEIKGIFCGCELLSSGVNRVKSGRYNDLIGLTKKEKYIDFYVKSHVSQKKTDGISIKY